MAEQPGAQTPARQTPERVAKEKAELGPNMSTTPPEDHHFLSTDGRKINAFGEEIGSPEDKKRKAAGKTSVPVPTAYSEATFAAYLASVLDTLADVLGWDASDPRVQEAVTDALLEYGEPTIASITGGTNLLKLRALGRRAIWRAVVQATAGFYAFTDVAQQQFSRQQINAQALKMLDQAEYECRTLGVDAAYAVQILSVGRPSDPYQVLPDSERVA